MATIKPVIVPTKAIKGGRHKIRISVAHNGETRYIVTDIVVNSESEFRNGMIVRRGDAAILNTRLRGFLQRYQNTIDSLGFVDSLSCADLVCMIKNERQREHRTLESIYEEYMGVASIRPGSARTYETCWRTVTKCIKKETLMEHLSYSSVMTFDKYLRMQKVASSTARVYVSFLVSLVRYAKKCGYVQYNVDPFANYRLPLSRIRQSWLSVDEIRAIRDCPLTKKNVRKCRDIFMLSYYLGGINAIDLVAIDFNANSDVIRYKRTKTSDKPKANEYVEFDVPDEAKAIIERYKGDDGRLIFTEWQRGDSLNSFMRHNLAIIGKATGIRKIIYYSARKSFSQHAFELGIQVPIIDFILGHNIGKGSSSTFAYMYVTPKMASEAVRKVLDNLK